MERSWEHRLRTNRRPRVHWGIKVLAYLWVTALVFVAGMVIGGMLSQDSFAQGASHEMDPGNTEEDGAKAQLICVDSIDQREGFPTGCESVAAVMALNHAGVDVSVEEFVDGYLPMGQEPQPDGSGGYLSADPNQVFLGDPRSENGWGCYAPVIQSAAECLLKEKEVEMKVEDLTGQGIKALCENYVTEGVPVILWGTIGMEAPRRGGTLTVASASGENRQIDWISPEHCLLLVGVDGESYWFNDPMEGQTVAYDQAAVQQAYEALGSQALAVVQH